MCPQMEKTVAKPLSRWWAIIIGAGLVLSPIHNQWLTNLATNSKGEVTFFLPAFGWLLIIMGVGMFLLYNWQQIKKSGWGDKRVFLPLIIICVAIALSGITQNGLQNKISPAFMALSVFGLYLVARAIGKELFVPLAIGAAVASIGVLIAGLLNPGQITGGLVFERNYDIVVGYVLLGSALFISKWRWLLAFLALIAILLSGSPEGLFVLGVLLIMVLVRKDWGKKLLAISAVLIVLAGIYLWAGYGGRLYQYAYGIITGLENENGHHAIGYRLEVIQAGMQEVRPLGTGYNVTAFRTGIVHNVPLIIVQQLGWPGIIAGLAWMWVTVYCLIKTRWKYAFALILALSVFDHFIWTQIGVWWWAIIGVSTGGVLIENDHVFRELKHREVSHYRAVRISRLMTRQDLAEKAQCHVSVIDALESGHHIPSKIREQVENILTK